MKQDKRYNAFISYNREDKMKAKLSKKTKKPQKSKQIRYFFVSSSLVLR